MAEKQEAQAEAWANHGIFYEDGIPISCMLSTKDSVRKLRNFLFKEEDVIVATYPKAGTTMTQEIVWLITHDGDIEAAGQEYVSTRVPFLEVAHPPKLKSQQNNELMPLEIFEKQTSRRVGKTHMPWQLGPDRAVELGAKLIYVMRDPRDTLVSNYYFAQGFSTPFLGTFDEFFDVYLSPVMEYGHIFDHYVEFWENRNNPNILVIYYEDLLYSHKEQVKKIASFLDKNLPDDVIDRIVEATTFKTMKENPATNFMHFGRWGLTTQHGFMRKGVAGDWKNHFNVNQKLRMDNLINERLAPLGIRY